MAESGEGEDPARWSVTLERLFREHVGDVRNYVASHYPSADVDDIVSVTFEVAGRRLADIRVGAERAWLIGVARNVMSNARRGDRRRGQFIDALIAARPRVTVDLAGEGILLDDIEPFQRAFAGLKASDREVLLLACWEELSTTELAEVLGLAPQRASDRIHRARKRLRDRVNQERER